MTSSELDRPAVSPSTVTDLCCSYSINWREKAPALVPTFAPASNAIAP